MSGLDPIGRKEIRDLVLRLRAGGKTVFMNTHILSDVEMLCDRVAILVAGRIRYEGVPQQILAGSERETEVVITGLAPELALQLESAREAALAGRPGRDPRGRERRAGAAGAAGVRARGGALGDAAARLARRDLPLGSEGQSLMSLGVILTLAHNTVREAVRNKVLYGASAMVLMIGSGSLVSSLSYVERERILQDVGLAAIRFFGVAIAIFIGIQLVHREVDRRTVYTILSKPISRAQFLVGKFAGLTLTIWLQTACMALAFAAISVAAHAPLAWQHLAFLLLLGAELALVVALATLFSAFTTPILAASSPRPLDGRPADARPAQHRPVLGRALAALRHRGAVPRLPDRRSFDLAS